MPRLLHSVPRYRQHKATGQSVVTVFGKDYYLGPWQSKASRAEYDRLIGEWLAAGRPTGACASDDLRVIELNRRYWEHARGYYRKDGQPTGTLEYIRVALRTLRKAYGRQPAAAIGPLAIKNLQQQLIAQNLSRVYINKLIDVIRREFKWGVSEQLLPASVFQAIQTVPGLRKGRSAARETAPVRPVSDSLVEATLNHLPPTVADMARLQRLTGARPGEICLMRPCARDPADRAIRILAGFKNNWSTTPESLRFRLTQRGRGVAVMWDRPSPLSADDLLALAKNPDGRGALREAQMFLVGILSDGPVAARTVMATAAESGISDRTLRRARESLGMILRPVGFG